MSRPFLAWSLTTSDFQDSIPPFSSLQFWPVDYCWTPRTGLCGFRRIEILQASSLLGRAGILFREAERIGRFLIALSQVLLFERKSRLVVAEGSLPDVTCPESPAE